MTVSTCFFDCSMAASKSPPSSTRWAAAIATKVNLKPLFGSSSLRVICHSSPLIGTGQDAYFRNFGSLKDIHHIDKFLNGQFLVRTHYHRRLRSFGMQRNQT